MWNEDKLTALTLLAGTVSHELNNIFTAINGNLSLLETTFESDSPGAQLVNDVLDTTQRGIKLSERLQTFSGRQRLQRARIDLNEVVTSVIPDMKRTTLRSANVELLLLPERCPISTDREKLRYVIEELIRNAMAAMEDHGWITVATGRKKIDHDQVPLLPAGDYVMLSIKDAGKGMNPDVMRRAPDPLFSTKPGHHGWGLACSAGFIRQCGGNIVLDSLPGKGTAVTIYLPAITADDLAAS